MPAQIFGPDAVVTMLNRAFYDASPAFTTFKNQLTATGTTSASKEAFARQFGVGFLGRSEAQLSNLLLKNMGVLPNTDLEAALTAYLIQVGKVHVGLVALQLGEILSGLEFATGTLAVYSAAATAWNSEVTAAYDYSSNPASTTQSGPGSGTELVLTKGVDVINGTSADDTITADNTVDAQLAAGDQINGGGGYDTLKVFLANAATGTGQPATLTSIEEVYIKGGAITAYTAATGTSRLSIDAPVANTAATYTVDGQSVSLANHTVVANTTTTVAQAASATATTQTITLNGISGNGGTHTLAVTGAKLTALDLAATGAASKIALAPGASITTLNITGDKGLTISASASTVTTVNAAGHSAGLGYAAGTAAASFKFTGGAGNDTLTFANDGLANLASGAQLVGGDGTGDKIGIFDTALTATETARINQATGFETLGLNASITLDAATLTGIKSFAVDTAALTATIGSMATGSTTAINASTTSLTLGAAVGVTDTAITLGGSTGGLVVGTLRTTGIMNVALASSGTAANTITALAHSDNSVFTLSGATDLGMKLATGTAMGSRIDGSAATGKLTLTGGDLTTSGDMLIGGAGADVLNGGKGADVLTGGAGVDIFSFTATAGANASGAAIGQADVITDFVVGVDKLQFAGVTAVASSQQAAVQQAVANLAAGASAADIASTMATASSTSLGVSFAVYAGNTYVLYETSGAGAGLAPDDVFIQLAGVTTPPTFANSVVA